MPGQATNTTAKQLEGVRTLLDASDDDRRRLASALHDSVAQPLAALGVTLDLLERDARAVPDDARRLLDESRLIVRQAFRELRALSDQLAPPLLAEAGLSRTVDWAIAAFTERTSVDVIRDLAECPRLPASLELAIFRLVEACLDSLEPELLRLSVPSVTLAVSDGTLTLSIRPLWPDAVNRWQERLRLRFGRAVHVKRTSLHVGGQMHGEAGELASLVLTAPVGDSAER